MPREVLVKRVSERPQLSGRYRGTVSELEASIEKYTKRYGDPISGGYDLIIDAANIDPQAVTQMIKSRM